MYCPFHFENHRIKSNDGITSFKYLGGIADKTDFEWKWTLGIY